jgi:eukaryotic-like serine/threonine-protein kinase
VPDPGLDASVGQVLAGRFRVVRVIGRTAVGILYEVQHEETQRTLTLETLGLPLKDDPGAFERFRHDADVVARLRHPSIAEIVEWQTLEDGSRCVAMERPDGEDLATRMTKGVPPWSMVSAVAEQVLTALEAAHQAGVMHGALTPQHILLARETGGRERCKVHGFGVSRIWHLYPHPSFADEARIDAAFYLSPEHAQGKTSELGPASDCFSFASILFALVTGKQPFSAGSAGAIIYKIGHGRADSILQHRPDAPPALDQVLARAWERDRERRLTAAALREELLAVLSSAQFLAGGSAEIPLHPDAAAAPSTLLLPEPLPAAADVETRPSALPAQRSLAALRQRRWFWPAVGGAALLLLLCIVSSARKGSAPPRPPAPAPIVAAPPPAAEPAVAAPPEPAVAPPPSAAADEDAPKQHHHHHHHHSSSSKSSSTTHKKQRR